MPKRYRTHPHRPGVIEAYYGRAPYERTPSIIYQWGDGLKGDAYLLFHVFSHNCIFNGYDVTGKRESVSFLQELETRGYDLSTLKFSIKKKQ